MAKTKSYEMTGTVTEVFDTQTVGTKGFQKREFRIKEEKDGEWPNIVGFTLKKDKCSLADSLSQGTKVTVHFNVEGRLWEPDDGRPSRCFIDLTCWKVDILEKSANVPAPATPDEDLGAGMDDDVPF